MGESVSVYIRDDALLDEARSLVDDGEFRNMSHVFEAGLEEVV